VEKAKEKELKDEERIGEAPGHDSGSENIAYEASSDFPSWDPFRFYPSNSA
jgi:hypothetical protein